MKLRRALGVALGSLALALGAVPAHAALYSHNDAARDVVVETCPDDEDDCTEAVDPTITNGDIVNANIRHQWRRVLVRVKQRDLALNSERGHFVRIITNEGQQRYVVLGAEPGQARPEAMILRARDFRPMSCSGLWTAYDHPNDMVTVIVPRYCLSHPSSVRVGVGSFTASETATAELWAYDDLMSSGVQDNVRLSPWIRRG